MRRPTRDEPGLCYHPRLWTVLCYHPRFAAAAPFPAWRFAFLASIFAHSRASRCSSSDGAGFGAGCCILAGGGVEAACVGACTGRWALMRTWSSWGRVCAGRSGLLVAASGQLAALGLGLRGLGLPPAFQDRIGEGDGKLGIDGLSFPRR